MFSKLRDFLTRHRRKYFITSLLVGGTYITLKYAQKKFIEMQERHAQEMLEKTKRMQHFITTEKTCNQLIISMGTELIHSILKECNTDELLLQLKENPPNKIELWEEMKIDSFTRLTTFIYASSMLVVALRIQLNLLGGHVYCDNAKNVASNPIINDNIKQQYLSLIRHFLQDGGLSELVRLLRYHVGSVVRQVPLTRRLRLSDMEEIFYNFQMIINNDPKFKIYNYLLPFELTDFGSNLEDGDMVRKMYYDTLDLLESDDVNTVCLDNITRGFSLAVDALAENLAETTMPEKSSSGNEENSLNKAGKQNNLPNINKVQIPFAKSIPIVNGLTAKGFDSSTRPQNLATSLITFYVGSEKCKVLGANVYETFSTA